MTIRYVSLGKAGVRVSTLCLGSLNFGWRTDGPEATQIIHRAMDGGITFIDAASCYAKERSEEIVGQALRGRRARAVLATKLYSLAGEGPNQQGNSRPYMIRRVEESLRRLQTDHIDLYLIHPDPETPLAETLRTLDDMVRAGKIRYYGLSHFRAAEVVETLWTCDRLGLEPPIAEQPLYHLLDRRAERELLPACRKFGLAITPHGPLANGLLTGKYSPGAPLPEGSRGAANRWPVDHPAFRPPLETAVQLRVLAEEAGLSLASLALAWLFQQPGVTAPVIGPRTAEQLDGYLQALAVNLPDQLCKRIDQIAPPGQTPEQP